MWLVHDPLNDNQKVFVSQSKKIHKLILKKNYLDPDTGECFLGWSKHNEAINTLMTQSAYLTNAMMQSTTHLTNTMTQSKTLSMAHKQTGN